MRIGRNAVSLDAVRRTTEYFSSEPAGHLGCAIGEMLGNSLSETELNCKYGTHRSDLSLDMTIAIFGSYLLSTYQNISSDDEIVVGLTSLRTRNLKTNEGGYLMVPHGEFYSDAIDFDPDSSMFPRRAWKSWLKNHDEQALALYCESSNAHGYIESAIEMASIPDHLWERRIENVMGRHH